MGDVKVIAKPLDAKQLQVGQVSNSTTEVSLTVGRGTVSPFGIGGREGREQ